MPVIDRLATSLGRRDEVPNQELAREIVAGQDDGAVQDLIGLLSHKDKAIRSDSIKVLYEIGEQYPALIEDYANDFVTLLDTNDNRMQWGAMTTLKTITNASPAAVYKALPKLAMIADKGSVITKDNYVAILIKLGSINKYAADAFALLNEQLMVCATNQLPMYAENALPIIADQFKPVFVNTLTARLDDFEKETKRKRVEKVLKKLAKG